MSSASSFLADTNILYLVKMGFDIFLPLVLLRNGDNYSPRSGSFPFHRPSQRRQRALNRTLPVKVVGVSATSVSVDQSGARPIGECHADALPIRLFQLTVLVSRPTTSKVCVTPKAVGW